MTAPIVAQVDVEVAPPAAFDLFTGDIGLWWRRDSPYWNDRDRALSVRIEPWPGGRFIEVYDLDTGEGFEVGRVLEWQPGQRFSFTWTQVGWHDAHTRVTITFAPVEHGTRVTLTHDGFDALPDTIDGRRDGYAGGWPVILAWFAGHTPFAGHIRRTHMVTITDDEMRAMLPTTKTYTAVILKAGPNRRMDGADAIVWEHGRRNFSLRADGRLSIVLPISDGSDVSGIGIFNLDVDQTREVMDGDPGVEAGVFVYELHPCRGFPGSVLP